VARVDLRGISLGRTLFPVLGEDKFDRGPLTRGPWGFVADTRIDNREELGRALRIQASALQNLSDATILFETLLRWGDDAPNMIAGEFAFALWNEERQTLTLGRDILGDRPLYIYRKRGFIAFASMPSGLHGLPEIPKDVDYDFVAEQLALLPQSGTSSFFKHIERIRPAHFLRIDPTGCMQQRYWTPQRPTRSTRSAASYEEELRAVFDEAVRSQLRGAGAVVASHLSGGLDSAAVTATAAREIPEGTRIAAFTAVPGRKFDGAAPPGRIADESQQAAALVQQYSNIDHTLVESVGSPLDGLDREHAFQQQPIGNLCNAVWGRRINKAAHERGATVLLTGDVGNMTISYAGLEWLSEVFASGRLTHAARLAASLARNGMPLHSVAAQMIGPMLPRRTWSAILRCSGREDYISTNTGLSDETLRTVLQKAEQREVDLSFRPFRDSFDLRVHVLLGSDGGNWVKGVLAEWGLSLRSPATDKRVIEFCLSVPTKEFIRGGVPRSLARRAFADRIPPEILHDTRRGYQGADWYEGIASDKPAIEAEISAIARNGKGAHVLNYGWLQDTINTFPKGGWDSHDVASRYRHGFLRALSAGHFMRKVAGTN